MIKLLFLFLIVCLFVWVVDNGVNEGEPIDEQYYETVNEDQFCDPEPKGQCFDQDLPEGFEDGKFNSALWCIFCPSFYKHNLLAYFTKIVYVLPAENTVG